MAYIVQDEEDENGLSQGAAAPSGENTVPAGQGGTVVTPNTGQQSQTDRGGQSAGGNYATLQKYMQANQDQTGTLAKNVAAPTSQLAQQAQDKSAQALADFSGRVGQNNFKQEDFDRIQSGLQYTPYAFQGSNLPVQQPSINRDAFDFRDEQNKSLARQGINATYQGPQSIAGDDLYRQASSAANQAKERADMGGTESGRFQLLQELYKKPSYTRGQQSLDQMLLQNAPGSREEFENARQKAQQAQSALQATDQSAQAAVNAEQGRVQTGAQNLRTGVNDAYANFFRDYGKMAEDLEPYRETQDQKDLKAALANNQLFVGNDALTGSLGLRDDSFISQYNLFDELGKYIDPGTAYSRENVANPYRADIAALAELGGIENDFSTANQAEAKRGGYNEEALQQDILKRAGDYRLQANIPKAISTDEFNQVLGLSGGLQPYDASSGRGWVEEQGRYNQGLNYLDQYRQKLEAEDQLLKNQGFMGLGASSLSKPQAWNFQTTPYREGANAPAYNELMRVLNDYNNMQGYLKQNAAHYTEDYLKNNVFTGGNEVAIPGAGGNVTETPSGPVYSTPAAGGGFQYTPPQPTFQRDTRTGPLRYIG